MFRKIDAHHWFVLGAGYLPAIATDFVYENLHGEPRYEALLRKMGLNSPKKSDEQEQNN